METNKFVEYWETKAVPATHKTSPGFRDHLNASLTPQVMADSFASPFLSRDEMAYRQLKRICDMVRIAYEKVPFYNQKYRAFGFEPGDLKTIDDYHRLPLVRKDELIEAFPHACVNKDYLQDDLFPTRSSGSSGTTLRILVNAEAIVTDTLQGFRQFWLQTNKDYNAQRSIVHVYTAPWWVDCLDNGSYQSYFISSLIRPKKIGAILSDIKPDIISLYPSNLASIAPYIDDQTREKLMVAVVHSEMSSKAERDMLAKELGRPVLDEYSSEELTRIALEMPSGLYHMCEDTVRLDIIDPETLTVLEQGTGLSVGTNLLNTAMPFIRYVQGDCITVGEQKPSALSWRQLEKIEGRFNDSFVAADNLLVPSGTILDVSYRWMFDIGINIHEFEMIQDAPRSVIVNVNEPKMRHNPDMVAQSSAHLRKLLECALNSPITMSFNMVDNIENSGKKRRPIRRTF